MTNTRRTSAWILIVGIALITALGTVATASSPFVSSPLEVGVAAVSILLPFAVAAELQFRYPKRSLAAVLVAVGVAYCIHSLGEINSSITYAPSRALGQFADVLLIWLMLAFPSGRLSRPWGVAIVLAGALSVVLLWFPVLATSTSIPHQGFYSQCGARCPHNSLLIFDQPDASRVFDALFRAIAGAIVLVTAGLLVNRLRTASAVTRHVLAPVLTASITRTLALAALMLLGSTTAVRGLLAASYLAVPVAIVVGLVLGRSYDAAALESLVRGLRSRPGPAELRTVMARALRDPTLQIAYWLPAANAYTNANGLRVTLADDVPGRAVTRVADRSGDPVAALLHDSALLDHPELLEALSSTAALALETNRLEAAVAAADAGTITAIEAERRRIERDLHDGTQQRLIALRMKLSVANRILGRDAARARSLLDELGGDIDSALGELRAVSHGVVPPLLVAHGLQGALTEIAFNAPVPVDIHFDHVSRIPPSIETAVYFCCLEALQNIAKHAGDGASAAVGVRATRERIAFTVSDDGQGFNPDDQPDGGRGLTNIRARIEELGGRLEITRRTGGGTEVHGSLPLSSCEHPDRCSPPDG